MEWQERYYRKEGLYFVDYSTDGSRIVLVEITRDRTVLHMGTEVYGDAWGIKRFLGPFTHENVCEGSHGSDK